MNPCREMFGPVATPPRFVIFSSYGNDSIALIQWAREQELRDVAVVFSDTKWAAPWWMNRVEHMEWWVESLGFWTDRTTSLGFVELARMKKAFPTQQYQWCSYILKIEPGERWLAENDPERRAVCLTGVRREESSARADFPRYLARSMNHGGRVMLTPFADSTEAERDGYLERAGVKPLPHRSMECGPCINSNRADIQALTEPEISKLEDLETEMNSEFGLTRNGKPRTFFRPHRHMGAVGIREVVSWANSPRGKFKPEHPVEDDVAEDLPPEKDGMACANGYCAN
ncbi:phosphoadenosine phosphosulfate reductase family protein [Mesorhizobium sp. M0145]|uniref:phosphoadenosine phosphosulfate reductase domain-containing protein n=1 Tax=Mesorhizobium sp. M0145 TaxID=2956895 RepID=UPI00333A7944